MTETEVHIEHPEHESIAEEVAESVQDVLEEMKEDEEHTESLQQMETEAAQLQADLAGHTHTEYANAEHFHSDLHSERIAILESRIEAVERGLEESIEEPIVEEIEPTPEPEPEPEPERKRRHSFGRR